MMAYASQIEPRPKTSPSRSGVAAIRHRFSGPRRMTKTDSPPPARLNDLIVLIAQSRDARAFELLFAHFAPRIKGYLIRLGTSGAAAEDLAQETMLAVWRKAPLFDPARASASTWIFTVARNLRIDLLRRERRPDFDPHDPAFVPGEEPAADALMMRDDEDEDLRAALE